MSIIVHGVDKPKDCRECPFSGIETYYGYNNLRLICRVSKEACREVTPTGEQIKKGAMDSCPIDQIEQNAQRLRETISGKEKDDQSYAVVDEYIKNNGITKIGITDANDIANIIKEGADNMLSAINTAIKVSNATTYIEI